MAKRMTKTETVTGRISRLVEECIKSEALPTDKEKSNRYTQIARNYKRFLGLHKGTNEGKYSSNAAITHIGTAKRRLKATDLLAHDYKEQLENAIKDNSEFKGVFEAIINSKKPKNKLVEEISNESNPEKLVGILKKLKLEHTVYYRISSARSANSTLAEMKADQKKKNRKAVTAKNKGTSSKSVTLALSAIKRAVKEGLNPKQTHANRIAVALILTTGRRNIEILKTGSFKYVSKNVVLFEGQAKKKNGIVAKPYEIPIMYSDARKVVAALKRLRSHATIKRLEGLANDEIHKTTNKTINEGATRALLEDNATFYSCRAAYALTAYKKYEDDYENGKETKGKSKNKLSKAGYSSTILGHSDDDVTTALSYEGVNIDNKKTIKQAEKHYSEQTAKKKKIVVATKEGVHPLLEKLVVLVDILPSLIENKRSLNGQAKILDWIIDACKKDSGFVVSRTNIRKFKGGKMEPISNILTLAGIEKES